MQHVGGTDEQPTVGDRDRRLDGSILHVDSRQDLELVSAGRQDDSFRPLTDAVQLVVRSGQRGPPRGRAATQLALPLLPTRQSIQAGQRAAALSVEDVKIAFVAERGAYVRRRAVEFPGNISITEISLAAALERE